MSEKKEKGTFVPNGNQSVIFSIPESPPDPPPKKIIELSPEELDRLPKVPQSGWW